MVWKVRREQKSPSTEGFTRWAASCDVADPSPQDMAERASSGVVTVPVPADAAKRTAAGEGALGAERPRLAYTWPSARPLSLSGHAQARRPASPFRRRTASLHGQVEGARNRGGMASPARGCNGISGRLLMLRCRATHLAEAACVARLPDRHCHPRTPKHRLLKPHAHLSPSIHFDDRAEGPGAYII